MTEAGTDPLRVVVVDDQALILGSLVRLVDAEPGMTVVGRAATGADAVRVVAEQLPDVVLMDIRMPGGDGLQATREICADPRLAACRVLVLTMVDEDESVVEALRAGAAGFLLKDCEPDVLLRAVRSVRAGDALLAPAITRRLVERFARPPHPSVDLATVTDRELEVWRLVARGRSNAEIADEFVVSTATVKTHVSRLLMKLGLRDRTQLVVAAYEHGVVTVGG